MKISRTILFIILAIFCVITLFIYFNAKLIYEWGSYELNLSRLFVILSFNSFFLILMFIINFEHYKLLFKYVLFMGLLIWLFVYSIQYTKIMLPMIFWNFWDLIVVLSFSIIGPGVILYILHYIKHHTAKYEDAKLFDKYHLHEGFFGLILTFSSIFLYLLRIYLMQFEIFWNQLGFFIAIINIFLFAFLFLGGFLTLRDWDDVISLKLIEKMDPRTNKILETDQTNSTSVFKNLTQEDLHFFKDPLFILYPFGIFLTSFSISAIVYGAGFLPREIFLLSNEMVMVLGFLFGFISGSLLGRDWLRLFKRFYPNLFEEIEQVITKLKK